MSWILKRWPISPTRPICRSLSTTPSLRPTSAGRSSTAPTSWCTPPRNSSAATARHRRSHRRHGRSIGTTGRFRDDRALHGYHGSGSTIPSAITFLIKARARACAIRAGAQPVQLVPLLTGVGVADPAHGPIPNALAVADFLESIPRSPGSVTPDCPPVRTTRLRKSTSEWGGRGHDPWEFEAACIRDSALSTA